MVAAVGRIVTTTEEESSMSEKRKLLSVEMIERVLRLRDELPPRLKEAVQHIEEAAGLSWMDGAPGRGGELTIKQC